MAEGDPAQAYLRDVALGTSIIAVAFPGGVVLGADSRTSSGSYVANRVQDKITPLADRVYLCRSGSASDTQAICGYVQYWVAEHQAEKGGPVDVSAAANLAMQLAYGNKNALQAGLIVAGWDAHAGGSVYAIPLGGTLLKVPYTIGGSGSAYITGWCDKHFREDFTEEQARAFVVAALTHAMARDASSGGCVRTVTITADGVKRDFIPGSKLAPTYGELPVPAAPPVPASSCHRAATERASSTSTTWAAMAFAASKIRAAVAALNSSSDAGGGDVGKEAAHVARVCRIPENEVLLETTGQRDGAQLLRSPARAPLFAGGGAAGWMRQSWHQHCYFLGQHPHAAAAWLQAQHQHAAGGSPGRGAAASDLLARQQLLRASLLEGAGAGGAAGGLRPAGGSGALPRAPPLLSPAGSGALKPQRSAPACGDGTPRLAAGRGAAPPGACFGCPRAPATMVRGPKKHMKRLNAPSHWMLDKLGGIFAPKPSPGPHKQRECLPLLLVLRNRLKYALTGKEVKMILMQRLVKVDGKVRTDATYPAGFMDVITLDRTNDAYRLVYDTKGRFVVHKITEEEASYKLCKVRRMQFGKGGIPYISTHDGRTIRYPDPEVKEQDTVMLDLETGKIKDFVKFDLGNLAMVTGGHNNGRVGTIVNKERHRGGHDIVHIEDAAGNRFATRISNVFVIGKGKQPLISLPKGKGVRLTILQEQNKRYKQE
ncbi:RPS4 [Scenedesmus sp. PABB004]|nr:RPS4 [Scenedesmus sp. PABB004]